MRVSLIKKIKIEYDPLASINGQFKVMGNMGLDERNQPSRWLAFSKMLISIGFLFGSFHIGEWWGNFAISTFSIQSESVLQAVAASQFTFSFVAIMLIARYAAVWLTTTPSLQSDVKFQLEKVIVRQTFSIVLAIVGVLWWSLEIFTFSMWGHPIFSWSMPILVLGIMLSSWYQGKGESYRAFLSNSNRHIRTDRYHVPSIVLLLSGITKKEIKVEKMGVDRGLPTIMLGISAKESDYWELNLGIDRLLPTAIVRENDSRDTNTSR